jgi:hypothetical protein
MDEGGWIMKYLSLTDKQRGFIPILIGWLEGLPDGEFRISNDRIRDSKHFLELLNKINIVGGYTDSERASLNTITEHYYSWNRKPLELAAPPSHSLYI